MPTVHPDYPSFNPKKKLRHWLKALGAVGDKDEYRLGKTVLKVTSLETSEDENYTRNE